MIKTLQQRLLRGVRDVPCARQMAAAVSTSTAPSDDPAQIASARPMKQIPGVRPLLGTGLKVFLGGKFVDNSAQLYKEYGPIVYEKFAPGVAFVRLYDPDDMAFVYRSEGTYPKRFPLPAVVQYSKDRKLPIGIANEKGEQWQRQRKTVNKPMLRPRAISAYLPTQEPVADEIIVRIRRLRDANNEVMDFMPELQQYAMEAVGVMLFDRRLHVVDPDLNPPAEAKRFIQAAIGLFVGAQKLNLSPPLYKIFPMPAYTTFCKHMDTVRQISEKHIEDLLERNRKGEVGSFVSAEDNVILGILQSELSKDEALSVIMDLFFAAIDTTANTTGFCLNHLAINPEAQTRLHEEIQKKVPRGKPITEEILGKMHYLKACVKETFRLNPIATIIPRILDKDIVVKGYHIPAGQPMAMCHAVSSMNESLFDQPDRYMPERWLRHDDTDDAAETSRNRKDIHPFASVPFGFGKRMCIGRRLAEQEMYLMLIKILQNFEVEYHHAPIKSEVRFVSTPSQPLRFTFKDKQ